MERNLNLSDNKLSPVLFFNELKVEQLVDAGGKAASLACLFQAGYPVPDGFIIFPYAFDDEELIPDARLKVQQYLERMRLKNTNISFAVRSSALSEDSTRASFAGEFETVLNVVSDKDIFDAIQTVRHSKKSERVRMYSKEKGIREEHEIAIVVQQMIPAEISGVVFTANPINGQRDQIVINASWGLGESIVSGTVTPDTYIISKKSGRIINKKIAKKEVMTVFEEKKTEESFVPDDMRKKPTLTNTQIHKLTKLCSEIEEFFGISMDIEWTFNDGKFSIVQERPVTTLPISGYSWKLPKGVYVAMRNNIVELMPNPLTPLYSTLGRTCINKGMHKSIKAFIGSSNVMPEELIITVNNYAYYNGSITLVQMVKIFLRSISIFKRMFSGAVKRWTEEFRPQYVEVIERWQQHKLCNLSAKELLNGVRELTEYAVEAYTTLVSGIIPAAWMTEGLLTFYYNLFIKTRKDPKAQVFLLGFNSKPIKAEKSLYDLAQWIKSHKALSGYIINNPVHKISKELENDNPPNGVEAKVWNEWKSRIDIHLKQYGDIIYDLDFATPVPSDNSETQIETIKFYITENDTNPYVRQENAEKEREEAIVSIEQRLRRGIRLRIFKKLLNLAQRYAPLREDGLAEVGLCYPLLRKMLKEIGHRFVKKGMIKGVDDIFWLYESEVKEAVDKLDKGVPLKLLAPVISTRKEGLSIVKQISPPKVLPHIKLPRIRFKVRQKTGKNIIKGVAASPGQITAYACIIRGPENFSKMKNGCVIVAPITTPAWTPLFARAAAIVTDVGGPLSMVL